MIPVICIIILSLNSRPEKNLELLIWPWKLTLIEAMFADQLATSTTHRAFDYHMCQGKEA